MHINQRKSDLLEGENQKGYLISKDTTKFDQESLVTGTLLMFLVQMHLSFSAHFSYVNYLWGDFAFCKIFFGSARNRVSKFFKCSKKFGRLNNHDWKPIEIWFVHNVVKLSLAIIATS